MITLNFEPIKITNKTKSRCFELYALGDNNGNIFTVGTSNDIAREFCKAKGIEIYAQPEEFKQVAGLYVDDSEFVIYGLRRINNVLSSN